MSADPLDDDHHEFLADPTPLDPNLLPAETTGGTGSTVVGAASAASIPVLNSYPSATATVYLDFDGHSEASWGGYSNIVTPAFDQDGDPTTFSTNELAAMEQIWRQVAEDFAPFNVNVTTVEPPSFANGVAVRVSIGGTGSWVGGNYGGVAYVDSFTNSMPNTVFVFSTNLYGNAKYTAEAVSHETGHAFGLQHQAKYDGSGNLVESYSTGTGDGRAPLMGSSYVATRGLWWNGTTFSSTTYQDDMSVIARSTNGFGYRADDHGNSAVTSTSLIVSGTQLSGSGVITTTSDVDYFAFTTGAGQITITVGVPQFNNLDARLELRSSTGALIASAAPSGSFGASITVSVAAGEYFLVVASQGNYGDVGNYAVAGTLVPSTSSINSPSNLQATVVSGGIALSWSDNATNETGYRVERSTDGLTWSVVANLGSNAAGYTDSSVVAGGTYTYRVQAYNAEASAYSASVTRSLAPSAPATLTANVVSSSRIDLTWSNVSGESGYVIERSLDGTTWVQVGTTSADVTTFSNTGLNASTTYHFRVTAVNAAGPSLASPSATAQTAAAAVAPAPPSDLSAVVISSTQIRLSWKDNSSNETGFVIERSSNNGKSFTVVGSVGADTTSFTDGTVKARTKYTYRVRAVATISSAPSNLASATTPTLARARSLSFSEGLVGGANSHLSSATQALQERVQELRGRVQDRLLSVTGHAPGQLQDQLETAGEVIDQLFASLAARFETL